MNITGLGFRSMRRRPKEAFLLGIAISASTAFAAVALLLSLNAHPAIVALASPTPDAASIVVDLSPTLDPADVAALAQDVAALPGSDEVAVQYEGTLEVATATGTGLWQLSSDLGSGALSKVTTINDGRGLAAGEVFLGARTAERAGVTAGDSIWIAEREFTVAGVGPLQEFGSDVAMLHAQDAAALGDELQTTRLLVVGSPDLAAVEASVALFDTAVNESIVRTGEVLREREASSITEAFAGVYAALGVFVALAIVAAVVIVTSTYRVLLGRRATELALLRSVGATRRQVTRSVTIEAGFVGLIAGAIGAGAGFAVARGVHAIAEYFGLISGSFIAAPLGLAGCVVLSVASAVIAATPAARAAAAMPPVAALGSARSAEARPIRRRRRLVLAGAAAFVATATAAAGMEVNDDTLGLGLAAVSGIAAFGALVSCAPMLVIAAATLLRPLISGSAAARLALSNVRRASRRTAAMTTTLTLGVGLTAALLVGIAGATADAQESVDGNFPAEVLIPASYVNDPDALIDRLETYPELEVSTDNGDILVDPASGVDHETLRAVIAEATSGITSELFWAEDSRAGIEQFMAIGQGIGFAMLGTTLIIALIGVAVSFSLSVAERRQELALLRALGVSKAGVRRSIAVEAALSGAVGALVGTVIGAIYGAIALRALGLDAGIPPLLSLVLLFIGVTAAAVAAAVIPLRQAGRVEPAAGLAAR